MFEWPVFAAFYFIVDWLVRVTFLVLAPLHRQPDTARSWILLALFLPIPAAFLYILIGQTRLPRWRQKQYEAFDRACSPNTKEMPHSEDELSLLVRKLGGYNPTTASNLNIITDYDGFVRALISAIDHAEKSVMLETYILHDDEVGGKIISVLNRATARGVRCYVLFDALGSHYWSTSVSAKLAEAGIEARTASAFQWSFMRLLRIDLRNHRKLYVIDDSRAFLGSQNLVAANFKRKIVNEELMIAVEGTIVGDLSQQFRKDWFVETGELLSALKPNTVGPIDTQLIPSGPELTDNAFALLLVYLIHRARSHITITAPYFVPDISLINALRTATMRNVKIEVFVSRKIDQLLVGLAQRSYYDELLQSGVLIYACRNRLLHAKHIAIDSLIVYIGSSNVDIRSFRLKSEIGVIIRNKDTCKSIDLVIEGYREESNLIKVGEWAARGSMIKIAENLCRMISPLL